MLKKCLLISFTLLFVLSCLACGGAPAPQAETTDAELTAEAVPTEGPTETAGITPEPEDDRFYVVDFNDVYASAGMEQIFETDDSVYYILEQGSANETVVYFSDKEYKEWMPLCGKPDCSHSPKETRCNAHLEGETHNKIWLYGKHIYYGSYARDDDEFSLWRMKLDGSDHEKLLTYRLDGRSSFGWYFHNKYLFFSTATSDTSTGEIMKKYYSADLSESSPKLNEFEVKDENGGPASLWIPLVGKGDKLYCYDYDLVLYCWDIPYGVMRRICQLPADPSIISTGMYDEDTLIICYGWDLGKIITVDVNTGELTVLNETEPQTEKWYRFYRGYIFGSNVTTPFNPKGLTGTDVYDHAGGSINSIPYEAYDTRITISYLLGDFVFGHDTYDEGSETADELPNWYLDIRDIGTDRLMWRRWCPEELTAKEWSEAENGN